MWYDHSFSFCTLNTSEIGLFIFHCFQEAIFNKAIHFFCFVSPSDIAIVAVFIFIIIIAVYFVEITVEELLWIWNVDGSSIFYIFFLHFVLIQSVIATEFCIKFIHPKTNCSALFLFHYNLIFLQLHLLA